MSVTGVLAVLSTPAPWATLTLGIAITIAQLLLALSMAAAAGRMAFGPRAQDRVLGLDTFYVNTMLLLITFGLRTGSDIYFEAALVISLVGFVGSVAFAKFLMRGEVIE